ncbi:PAS domain-containing hybrid sensor histidine kinase/response regulator [Hymenobacter arizonensis]|uniref:histidine kinase n=1 Tax=Hymenobacter arizonensis TaxID=1227077 RepID=A0A1I6AG13_HYMAR|nr:PAS domain-containing hybrid sensor histidine kinase/response regulator [Hymenobacter arizonensis]SFQ67487.1 PAS domain S-box-containing protein [Hymenobacter arizonensis]
MMRFSRVPRLARRAAMPAIRRVAERAARQAHALSLLSPANTEPPSEQNLADKVPLILFNYNLRRRQLTQCNQHCQTVLGYSSQELVAMGASLGCLLHPTSRQQLQRDDLEGLLAAGQGLSWDCRLRHRDGTWRWLRIRLRASAPTPDGQVLEMLGSAEDVTRHRAAVEELRQSRHLLRQVLDLVPNLIFIYDLSKKRNTYSNRLSEQVLGYTSEELLAFSEDALLPGLVPPPALEQLREHFAQVAQLPGGEPLTLEFSVRHRDGSLRWLRSTHAPFARDASGQVTSIIGVAENITERRASEERSQAATAHLAEQHRLFRQVIDALPHPVYLKDGEGNYLLANKAMAALYGLTPDELVLHGTGQAPAMTTAEADRYRTQDQQVLATGQDLTLQESYTYPDGQVAWFSSVKRLFVRADGTAQVLGVDSNITELKQAQQALEAAIAAAEVDAQAKQDFLANMSHEIRTPLHGILGLTGVLSKTTLSRSQHDYLRLLGESADHLLMVLNDVLTTARLGAGKLSPETSPFDPKELLMGCAALLRPRAHEKGLRLRVAKPTKLPPVLGDAHRLRQVLLNLVSNAIKFTETGEVLLRCRKVAPPRSRTEPAGTVWLQFTVTDTGVGMTPATLEKVFEPFAQAAASTDREYGGTGLGLSISEGLVRLMGGVLQVSSEIGQGSTFAFTLAFPPVPAAISPGPLHTAHTPVDTTGGRILLVEDNLVNSLLAETVLRNWGWQVTTAANGPAAIQLFEHRPFDLVLMDIQMPGMDGETAARFLRQHPEPARAATPIIALTARAQAGEAERLQAAGFDGYLAKPYREQQLLDTMQDVLTRQQVLAEPTPLYTTTPNMPSAKPLYDLSNVRQLVRQDEKIVRRLAWAFIETTPAILTALDEALTRGNWEEVGDAAHHLKSSLDGLGVESLRLVIREIENYGAKPPTPSHAAQQVALVRATTEQVMADLRTEFPEEQQQ